MRKIIYSNTLDYNTFEPVIQVKILSEDGPKTILEKKASTGSSPMIYRDKEYTADQYQLIEVCNKGLLDNNLPEMTIEEADFMLARSNYVQKLKEYDDKITDPAELQKLSGFKVKKIIEEI